MYVHLVQSVFDIEKRDTKRKASSETTITRIEPAPIRKTKIGRGMLLYRFDQQGDTC